MLQTDTGADAGANTGADHGANAGANTGVKENARVRRQRRPWRRPVRASWIAAALIGLCGSATPAFCAPDTPAPGGTATPVVPMPSLEITPKAPAEPFRGSAGDAEFGTLSGAGQYRRCLRLVQTDPDDAYDLAQTWREQGGSSPAQHCAALALIELGHSAEAASRLEDLAREPGGVEVPLRVQILGQAGNAWLLADNPGRAIAAFGAGIDLAARDPEANSLTLYYDRARARALLQDWRAVEQDLSHVLSVRARNLSALVLRARARRLNGDHGGAAADIEAALALSPKDPAALIERGQQRLGVNKVEAARQDLLAAAVGGEGTPLAEAAQALLEDLDLVVFDRASVASATQTTGVGQAPGVAQTGADQSGSRQSGARQSGAGQSRSAQSRSAQSRATGPGPGPSQAGPSAPASAVAALDGPADFGPSRSAGDGTAGAVSSLPPEPVPGDPAPVAGADTPAPPLVASTKLTSQPRRAVDILLDQGFLAIEQSKEEEEPAPDETSQLVPPADDPAYDDRPPQSIAQVIGAPPLVLRRGETALAPRSLARAQARPATHTPSARLIANPALEPWPIQPLHMKLRTAHGGG